MCLFLQRDLIRWLPLLAREGQRDNLLPLEQLAAVAEWQRWGDGDVRRMDPVGPAEPL